MKKVSLRMCIGCGEFRDKKAMLRVVSSQEGAFSIDATGKANGRGAYLCRDRSCLGRAVKGRGLERSFKRKIPAGAYEKLTEEFVRIEEE